MAKFVPHKALDSIASGKVNFDERVVVYRVVGIMVESFGCFKKGSHLRLIDFRITQVWARE